MPGPHLIYFADPMCSWCYGFSPVIAAIAAQYGDTLPIRPIMGGLRPGTQETMDDETKQMIRGHWRHVQEASGQPFDYAFFDRPFFVYDTEPAARAVVVLRRPGPAAGLAALARIQRAFYAENRDVTDADTLADLAAGLGHDRAAFLADWDSDDTRRETRQDFILTQRAGIGGFPALIAGKGDNLGYDLIANGYQPAARVLATLDAWQAKLPQA